MIAAGLIETLLQQGNEFGHAAFIIVIAQTTLLPRSPDRFALGMMCGVVTNEIETFLDRAIGKDFLSGLEELVQIFLPIREQTRARAGRFEQTHIVGVAFGDI